jgi:hypothetical protein
MLIPMVHFLFRFDAFFKGFQALFWNHHKFLFRNKLLLRRLTETIVTIPDSVLKWQFFLTRPFFRKYIFQLLITMGCGSLFTRLQLPLQPWWPNVYTLGEADLGTCLLLGKLRYSEKYFIWEACFLCFFDEVHNWQGCQGAVPKYYLNSF